MLNPCQTDFSCQGCGADFDNIVSLHDHIKTHKLSPEKYYLKYYPRVDLYTKEPLRYKSRESYFSNDFITRTNLKKWLQEREEIDGDLVRDYCKNWLLNRKSNKKLVYAPCHLELKTLIAPQIDYYNELFGSYYALCRELGFKDRYTTPEQNKDCLNKSVSDFKVIIDTREQRALSFGDSKVDTLKFGDYARANEGANSVRIERKSLPDAIQTFGVGLDRFEREIQRAKDAGCNLVILVEDKFSNFMSFPYLPHIRSKCTVDYISHNIRYLINSYDNVQFLFCDNRVEAARLIKKLLGNTDLFNLFDLQLAFDKKLL